MPDHLARMEDAGALEESPPSPMLALLGPEGIDAALKSGGFNAEEITRILIQHSRDPNPKVSIHGISLLLKYVQLVARLNGAITKAKQSEVSPDGTTRSISAERVAPILPARPVPSQLGNSRYQPRRTDRGPGSADPAEGEGDDAVPAAGVGPGPGAAGGPDAPGPGD